METNSSKNTATFIHLSVLTQYFIPFGNFIFPIVIWSHARRDSEFIDNHGRNAINFQLSMFLYSLLLCLIAIPVLVFTVFKNVPFSAMINDEEVYVNNFSAGNITGIVTVALFAVILFFFMKAAEFFLIIYAAVKASNGLEYNYPLTIPFIKKETETITPSLENTEMPQPMS